MSLRSITEDEKLSPEIGRYEKIRIAVGYSPSMRAYYVKLSDIVDPNTSAFVIDRSDTAYLRFIATNDFLSSLHVALDSKGMYVDGNEEELVRVVSDLTLKLMERKRHEEK